MAERDRTYPFEFVCYRITKYRKRGPSTGYAIPGKALLADLVTMAEVISRKANLSTKELGEPFKTHQELAEDLKVSTKTIRRWRNRGLMGLRVVFEDGVNRLAFLQGTIDRFVAKCLGKSDLEITPAPIDAEAIRKIYAAGLHG